MATFQEAYAEQYGRHLVASCSLRPGQLVLQQQPYAAVLYDDQVPVRCDWCFSTADGSLMRCGRSKFAHYCCQAHQRAAWKAYYKLECAALEACAPHVPPASVRLAARVLWRRDREVQQHKEQEQQPEQQPSTPAQRLQQQLSGGLYSDVEQLLSHWEDLDDSRKIQYAQMAVLTREYMQGSTRQQQQQQQQLVGSTPALPTTATATATGSPASSLPDVKHIAQLLARFACNNHTICDEELRPIGVGLYPLGALVNHDCQPNCIQGFAGPNIQFRSLRGIPAGQQLTISYVELAATRQERRRQLLQQYFFDIDTDAPQQHNTMQSQQQQQQQPGVHQEPQQGQQQQQQHQAHQNVASASTAAAEEEPQMTPAAVQAPGTHKLQLCCEPLQQHQGLGGLSHPSLPQLLPPPPLNSSSSTSHNQHNGAAAADNTRGASTSFLLPLTASSSSSKPPWPEDFADRQLCSMVQHPQQPQQSQLHHGSPAVSSSSLSSRNANRQEQLQQQQRAALPGGMCLLPVLVSQSGTREQGAAAAAAVAGLFSDLEVMEQDSSMDVDSTNMQTEQQQKQENPPTHQLFEAVQWGDWAAAAAAGTTDASLTRSILLQQPTVGLAIGAAGVLLAIHNMLHQADSLTSQGSAAAAVKLYQKILDVADGASLESQMRVTVAAAATDVDPGSTGADIGVTSGPNLQESAAPIASGTDSGALATQSAAVGGTALAAAQPLSSNSSGSSSSSDRGFKMCLGPQHILRVRVITGLMKAAVDAADWGVALEAARRLVPLYELVYPKVWPNLGLHYALQAKLEMLLEHPAAAAQAAEAAARILQITHDSRSTVLQEVLRLKFEAAQEMAAAAQAPY